MARSSWWLVISSLSRPREELESDDDEQYPEGEQRLCPIASPETLSTVR